MKSKEVLKQILEKAKTTKTVKVLELHSQGLTNKEIEEKIGLNERQITSVLFRFNLKCNKYKSFEPQNDLKQLIIGSMLGDGSLTKDVQKNGRCNSSLRVTHCLAQQDYMIWKSEILKKYDLLAGNYSQQIIDDRFKIPEYTQIRLQSIAHPYFTELRKKFYKENCKYKSVSKEIIDEIDGMGLAIWLMDDGNITSSSIQLNTQSFNKEDLNYLKETLFNKFKLKSTIHKDGAIYILTESFETFKSHTEKFVVPSMKYKLIPYSKIK